MAPPGRLGALRTIREARSPSDWTGRNQGKRLVYATDTTGDLSSEHAEWSSGADLLMHECYFRDAAQDWALIKDGT